MHGALFKKEEEEEELGEKRRKKGEKRRRRRIVRSLERRGIERGKELVVVPHPDISIALMLQKVVALVSS